MRASRFHKIDKFAMHKPQVALIHNKQHAITTTTTKKPTHLEQSVFALCIESIPLKFGGRVPLDIHFPMQLYIMLAVTDIMVSVSLSDKIVIPFN